METRDVEVLGRIGRLAERVEDEREEVGWEGGRGGGGWGVGRGVGGGG